MLDVTLLPPSTRPVSEIYSRLLEMEHVLWQGYFEAGIMALHVYEEQCESFQPPDLEHKLQSLVEGLEECQTACLQDGLAMWRGMVSSLQTPSLAAPLIERFERKHNAELESLQKLLQILGQNHEDLVRRSAE